MSTPAKNTSAALEKPVAAEEASRLHSDSLEDTVAPVLSPNDLRTCAKFGERCSFEAGEKLFSSGDQPLDCYVIISGEICILDASADELKTVICYGEGRFTGDIDLFTGRPAVVSCEARTAVEAIRIPPGKMRELFVRESALGELFWQAFQRRRDLLLQTAFEGLRVYGSKEDRQTLQMVEFLFRNGVPSRWMDIAEEENRIRLREIADEPLRYPVITYGKVPLFQSPSLYEVAERIGLRHRLPEKTYDVLVLGAGPSGLGAAVYAASEGLSTLVLDGLGPGGQAGSSSKIENYAGFPSGIAGRELAQLSYLQALKFGADFVAPCNVVELRRRDGGLYGVHTSEGDCAVGKTVIVATGVTYRLLNVEGVDALRGSGIFYNATKVEGLLCQDCPVHVVGAGNSAGQAAMFLSRFAQNVSLLVRGDDIRKSMSSYLSERVQANSRITIRYGTEIVAVEGEEHIEAVRLRDSEGNIAREGTAGLFIFIGAKPCTTFLPPEVGRDEKGFVITGGAAAECNAWQEDRLPYQLETSLPGIFAAGDCRSGTTKRVAFAIGDGALAVTYVHGILGTYA